jgi:hypothetical protein
MHHTPCTVHRAPYTVHHTPYTVHHTPYPHYTHRFNHRTEGGVAGREEGADGSAAEGASHVLTALSCRLNGSVQHFSFSLLLLLLL